ncbi:MAG: hypothetical protein U9O98_02100 [Asgard group archaeon]|nr:hypothetical protein [Asgard group archaeon]
MQIPSLEPLPLSTANPGKVKKYSWNVQLAQKTGTNGPRDIFSAYKVDFFDKFAIAFAKALESEQILVGYDGSRYHQSISKSAKELLRRSSITVKELSEAVTVPEFMFACNKLGMPGCFFGRSHSTQEYVGLKLVINTQHVLTLLEKLQADISTLKKPKNNLYGFLPRTLAPIIEQKLEQNDMGNPLEIGSSSEIDTGDMREEFFQSLKKITPLKNISGEYIIDCRHSMAGKVWELIDSETNATITLDNDTLDPTAPDRDPREIWPDLAKKYAPKKAAVFDHDADADRTFLVKTPGKGVENIVHNQEESFTTGLLAEARVAKPDAYLLVQERISLVMLSSLQKYTDKVYATAQGEPFFFLGAIEVLAENPAFKNISGADYTNIFLKPEHPVCMKSPYQQALWLMHWFTKQHTLPKFPKVELVKTKIPMTNLDYPQRLKKVLGARKDIIEFFENNYTIHYHSQIDGQNLIIEDEKQNKIVISIRPSGTGRYTKVYTEIGLGKTTAKEQKTQAEAINTTIEKIILK